MVLLGQMVLFGEAYTEFSQPLLLGLIEKSVWECQGDLKDKWHYP